MPSPDPSRKREGKEDGPERKCVLTGDKVDRASLIRLVLSPEGEVLADVRAKAPGRGAWIGVDREALQRAIDSGKLKSALFRAFRRRDLTVSADLPEQIERQLERAALDRLGLEARASTIVTGGERIETAARAGKVALLLHAADAGEDGNRKLDQALRVGSDAEGSGLKGLVIAAPRTILSSALGRENVVHVAVTDPGAARRVGDVIARWHRFIGFGSGERPCETVPQGSIAAAASSDAAAPAANEGLTTVHE
ncbi:DUF448 domain-containing protein [Sphingomonas sp. MAH-20]|uniref:DUF448 domain-containing protein n=1 Tax=Sphingomonas horti TaxID=2682842 RepID=A0A6I4J416_9SPHN|nr:MULTISPECIES: DUF448 domain-containing protein [Sphingomonas]MBA2921178.1 DUF448 domain-containing protein [Sphingomonas sp. CGMCC 1.13658]MVO79419.1 DUF448 domain-containing protein [Sphingomonas horti]